MEKRKTAISTALILLIAVTFASCKWCFEDDSPGPTPLPTAPSDHTASAISSSIISLVWTDNSTDEMEFYVERSSISEISGFTQVATVAANKTSHYDTGLNASTTYWYRVRAHNSAGNSPYSNTTSAITQATATYSLTVNKAGMGSGTVTGTGINCGSDCTHSYPSGTTVTLNATPGSGSSFSGWSGCDSTSGSSCTVTMEQNKTVIATFNVAISTSITITDLPTTDSDGNYTLTWTATGLISTPWTIHEDSDASFSSPTTYLSYDNTSPYTYNFTGKADGIYYYRVGLSSTGPFSAPASITVARPTSAILRIYNNTHYYMVDIQLNGYQQMSYPNVIPASGYADFTFSSSSAVNYYLGVGFYDSYGNPDVWFYTQGSTSVTAGSTTTVTFNNPTIAQLLSGFSSYNDWTGDYFCYTCQYLINYKTFRFNSSGGWTLYDNSALAGSGSVTLVSWPDYSTYIQFKICSTCDVITMYYPFGAFYYENGPPESSIIEYVRQ